MQKPAFKHHGEKILCQVLSVGNGVTLAADEREDWPPIDFAKLGKRGVRLFFVTVGMMLDVRVAIAHFGLVLLFLGIVVGAKLALIFVLPLVSRALGLPTGVAGAWIGTSEFAAAAGLAAAVRPHPGRRARLRLGG